MKDILAIIGVCTIIIFVSVGVMLFGTYVKDKIAELKYAYKRKHRFDKKPLAKCYCVDCIFRNPQSTYCTHFSKHTGDAEFCSVGACRKTDPDRDGEKEK